jgi:hypothetical protein
MFASCVQQQHDNVKGRRWMSDVRLLCAMCEQQANLKRQMNYHPPLTAEMCLQAVFNPTRQQGGGGGTNRL